MGLAKITTWPSYYSSIWGSVRSAAAPSAATDDDNGDGDDDDAVNIKASSDTCQCQTETAIWIFHITTKPPLLEPASSSLSKV